MNSSEDYKARSVWLNKEYCMFISYEDFLKYVWGLTEEYKDEETTNNEQI